MARFWRIAAILSVGAVLAALPACGKGGSDSGKPKVAIITNCADPFWDICQAGALQAGKDFGVDVTFKQPEQMTVDLQMKIVADQVKLGIKGLGVSVINPKEQTDKLKAIAAQLPSNNFITIDNDADQTGRLCYVGVDNFAAGKEAGRMVKRALPNGGIIALFIGSTDSANAVKRISGVLSELSGRDVTSEVAAGKYEDKYGNYTLYRKQPITDDGKKDKAESNADAAMGEFLTTPNVCFVGLYAYNPAKALESARRKGLVGKIKIVGFDEDLVTLDGIDKGEIEGSVSQDPYGYGYETVRWLKHIIDGKDKKDLPQAASAYSVITRDGNPHDNTTPGIKAKKSADYSKIVSDALKAGKK
jgi:ribose transport system substrate-binding protein